MIDTAARIKSTRNATCCHSRMRICSARCRPMPPAPTMPMMVADRVFELEEVEHLADENRHHLRHDSVAHGMRVCAACRLDALDRLVVSVLDGLGEQLAENGQVRRHDGENARKGPEANDIDPDERPDERIDASDRVERAPCKELDEAAGHDVSRGEQAQRKRDERCQKGAEKGDGKRLCHRPEIRPELFLVAVLRRPHQLQERAELIDAIPDAQPRELENNQARHEQADECRNDGHRQCPRTPARRQNCRMAVANAGEIAEQACADGAVALAALRGTRHGRCSRPIR